MSFVIRPFAPTDYEAVAAIVSNAYPENLTTAEEVQYDDEHRAPHCKSQRWVAELDGKVVAYVDYTQWEGRYHPQKFWIYGGVLPGYQQQGMGTALYETISKALAALNPMTVYAQAREDLPHGMKFLTDRGYVEIERTWESVLDLAGFDPEPWRAYAAKVESAGIRLISQAELASDPERDTKLHALINQLRIDVPSPEPATAIPWENFVERYVTSPTLLPEGCFVAVTPDGRYVGFTGLYKDSGDGLFNTGLTGVLREYRGSGIAQALKLKATLWAREQGARGIRTFNASTNAPMLAINLRMGFVRRPAWVDFARHF